ncbi:hypothetical protein L1285_11025 [Pseudoalteromonas sp. DL2-H2.2]|uniref:formyltransferase family protein n=1 Tax=Pseudoalteromonas sp. DL2-H2.2 TaxID=2908889 RepID=UPI001F36CC91|nr:formyltransferase family protein [Pseudoalteromonas sp. DL2-H2.2]MCF2908850.1 hypothetical protein [Pseudoalteromonas sp. DL2-H2.2]
MKVILFGNVPLASWLIEQLFLSKIELLGVVYDDHQSNDFSHHGMNYTTAKATCEKLGINRISFTEAKELALKEPILGISVRYHKLFKKDYFEAFSPGIINLHGGELPRFRGTNIANHAVLQNVKRGAGTLHYIDEGVDCGDIVYREFFDVVDNATAFDFFTQTLCALQAASIKLIKLLEEGKEIPRTNQDYYINELGEVAHEYKKKDLDKLKEITQYDLINGMVDRKVRAFTFGDHCGAYLSEGDKKYLVSKA